MGGGNRLRGIRYRLEVLGRQSQRSTRVLSASLGMELRGNRIRVERLWIKTTISLARLADQIPGANVRNQHRVYKSSKIFLVVLSISNTRSSTILVRPSAISFTARG